MDILFAFLTLFLTFVVKVCVLLHKLVNYNFEQFFDLYLQVFFKYSTNPQNWLNFYIEKSKQPPEYLESNLFGLIVIIPVIFSTQIKPYITKILNKPILPIKTHFLTDHVIKQFAIQSAIIGPKYYVPILPISNWSNFIIGQKQFCGKISSDKAISLFYNYGAYYTDFRVFTALPTLSIYYTTGFPFESFRIQNPHLFNQPSFANTQNNSLVVQNVTQNDNTKSTACNAVVQHYPEVSQKSIVNLIPMEFKQRVKFSELSQDTQNYYFIKGLSDDLIPFLENSDFFSNLEVLQQDFGKKMKLHFFFRFILIATSIKMIASKRPPEIVFLLHYTTFPGKNISDIAFIAKHVPLIHRLPPLNFLPVFEQKIQNAVLNSNHNFLPKTHPSHFVKVEEGASAVLMNELNKRSQLMMFQNHGLVPTMLNYTGNTNPDCYRVVNFTRGRISGLFQKFHKEYAVDCKWKEKYVVDDLLGRPLIFIVHTEKELYSVTEFIHNMIIQDIRKQLDIQSPNITSQLEPLLADLENNVKNYLETKDGKVFHSNLVYIEDTHRHICMEIGLGIPLPQIISTQNLDPQVIKDLQNEFLEQIIYSFQSGSEAHIAMEKVLDGYNGKLTDFNKLLMLFLKNYIAEQFV
jgi:hypothetical protein